jgi:hypothetical protein
MRTALSRVLIRLRTALSAFAKLLRGRNRAAEIPKIVCLVRMREVHHVDQSLVRCDCVPWKDVVPDMSRG